MRIVKSMVHMLAPNVLPKARGLVVELGDSLVKAMGVHVEGGRGGGGGGGGKERREAARGEGRKGRAGRDGVEGIGMERGRGIGGGMDWSCCGEVHCCWLYNIDANLLGT